MNEIVAEVYETRRLLKWHWRFRFIAANGKVIGHQYNNFSDAVVAVRRIARAQIRLRIIRRDGSIEERGLE